MEEPRDSVIVMERKEEGGLELDVGGDIGQKSRREDGRVRGALGFLPEETQSSLRRERRRRPRGVQLAAHWSRGEPLRTPRRSTRGAAGPATRVLLRAPGCRHRVDVVPDPGSPPHLVPLSLLQ